MAAKLRMAVNTDMCRRKLGLMVLGGLLLLVPMRGLAVQTTAVQGIVYRADGTLAQGTVLVSWPAFTAPDGSTIAAGNTTATIAPDGSLNLALAPNAGANPAGTYYTVVYHMSDGTVQTEYWVVPQTATVTISEMRATVVPAAVAQQTVSQQYVDASIGALQGTLEEDYLQLKGGTMSGPLLLNEDPVAAMEAATKQYVDAHSGMQLPQARNVIAGSGDGGAVPLPEKGVTVTGSNGNVAWDDDLNAGIYDPRDPRWGPQDTPAHQAAAIQAMSNQMACDLAMGTVVNAVAKFPQGSFAIDQLLMAPGSSWQGTANSDGGTAWHSIYNNHQLARAPASMTVTCADGQSHTDSAGTTHITHFTLNGCAQGGCTNAPGDTGSYAVGGPGNVGLEMSSTAGIVEHVFAQAFGGYGIRTDGQDGKTFHLRVYNDLDWYYYGGYKGLTESAASAEVSATTTGSTGSVALSWPAVTNATGYVIYRGTSAGNESVFYTSSTNSFTDTGTAGASGSVTNVVTNSLNMPGTIAPAVSTMGGTLAAGTYYYRVTATQADGWHASVELYSLDAMADWIEAYGLFDAPTVYTYHHLADVIGGGGDAHYDHIWAQLGQVGIAQPYGDGAGNQYTNIRIDFARLEGFFTTDISVYVRGGIIDGSCTASNAATINTGQVLPQFAGTCNQFLSVNGSNLTDVLFTDNNGFGPTYKTADVLNPGYTGNVNGSFQFIPGIGTFGPAQTQQNFNAVNVTGPEPNIVGLLWVNPNDTKPIAYDAFTGLIAGADFYIRGGNANVTLQNNSNIVTCSKQNVNLGNVAGFLHFRVTGADVYRGNTGHVAEVCNTSSLNVLASSETVTYSATPAFSTATRASVVTLTGNVTNFTLAPGLDGQEKTLTFCQNATGGFTVTPPANVRGLMSVGTTAGTCSSQHFTYAAAQSAWLADSPGVTNE